MAAEVDERATATFRAGGAAALEDFAGRAAVRFSRAGFADAFAGLFAARFARLAVRAGLDGGWRLLDFLPALFLAFFPPLFVVERAERAERAERTGALVLRRLAALLTEGRLFAFFAMTV